MPSSSLAALLASVVALVMRWRRSRDREPSTLVIAALFSPLRRRVQYFIDRRFYRSRYDARKPLEAFSTTLRDETNLKALNDGLVGVVKETMQPAHVGRWLRNPHARE